MTKTANKKADAEDGYVIRLTWGWLLAVVAVFVGLGMAGGLAGEQLFRTPLPVLPADKDKVITTVQQVTISPNTTAADIVARAQRSVLMLAAAEGAGKPAVIAFAITNDGVLASAGVLPAGPLTAWDSEGRKINIERIGRDELWGLNYFRVKNNVIAPLDTRLTDAAVGSELLGISRSFTTLTPKAIHYPVEEYALPQDEEAPGVQRIMNSNLSAGLLPGTPLLDEEGKVAGVIMRDGLALPSSELKESFNRLANNKREQNVLNDLGLTLHYIMSAATDGGPVNFAAAVVAVSPGSPAATAGLKRDDRITQIKGEALSWERSFAGQLGQIKPLVLTIWRDGLQTTITLP